MDGDWTARHPQFTCRRAGCIHLALERFSLERYTPRPWHMDRARERINTPMQGGNCVDTLIIAGIETVVGANLAAAFSDANLERMHGNPPNRVIGLSFSKSVSIPGVECSRVLDGQDELARHLVANSESPRILLCGATAVSCWYSQPSPLKLTQQLKRDRSFAELAAEFDCRMTAISSDAVFSGPWVFHDEDSESHCSSHEAELIRGWERDIAELHSATRFPTISEGARRLFEQSQKGFRDRLRSSAAHVKQVA